MDKIGRFAPSPSGRMHLGNVLSALLAWLSATHDGGRAILRIEDIDPDRCADKARALQLIEDLHWLGMYADQTADNVVWQSNRTAAYTAVFERWQQAGLLYPCYCTRAALHAASAPHAGDGNSVYNGHCRRYLQGDTPPAGRTPAWRLTVPDKTVIFTDGVQGVYSEYLPADCGDFSIRRADGVFAYQLAVVLDDIAAGVTEVVRGRDLLSSTPRQMYMYDLLGATPPQYYHIPLILGKDGSRLSKRDGAADMGYWREKFADPAPLLGMLAYNCGVIPAYQPMTANRLQRVFDWSKIKREDIYLDFCDLI